MPSVLVFLLSFFRFMQISVACTACRISSILRCNGFKRCIASIFWHKSSASCAFCSSSVASDVISCDKCISDEIDAKIKIERALKYVETVLSERERQIIIMRYGLYGRRALTQRETAERLNISRSYVSRIEKSALDKLLDAFKSRK